jgi:hypothetical protein
MEERGVRNVIEAVLWDLKDGSYVARVIGDYEDLTKSLAEICDRLDGKAVIHEPHQYGFVSEPLAKHRPLNQVLKSNPLYQLMAEGCANTGPVLVRCGIALRTGDDLHKDYTTLFETYEGNFSKSFNLLDSKQPDFYDSLFHRDSKSPRVLASNQITKSD